MSIKAYQYEEGKFRVTDEMKSEFDTKGYIMVRNLLSEAELKRVREVLENSDVVNKYALNLSDGTKDGRKSMMCLWNQPGNDVTGMIARSEKIAGTCEKLLGGEVYHYHTKLMMKEAHTGGQFIWHQDYGYWYKYTCPFPDMMTAFIALDPCRQDNGCLQILEGSNRCGRIDHEAKVGQMGADMERVEHIKALCPHLHVDMDPGDVLFFHCNLLHASGQNDGPNRRWAFLCAFNRASNNPFKEHTHPLYTKLHKVPNSAILECKVDWDVDSKSFLTQEIRDRMFKKYNP